MNRRALSLLVFVLPAIVLADPTTQPTLVNLPRSSTTQPTTAPATQSADADSPTAPTLVTLDIKDANVEDILKQFSKQTGYTLKPFNVQILRMRNGGNTVPLPKYSLHYDHVPFWDAVIDFSKKTQVAPFFDGSPTNQLMFMPVNQMGMSTLNCPTSVSGAAISLLTMMSRQQSVEFARNARGQDQFDAQMSVRFEPKVKIVSYRNYAHVKQAVDDHGNSLLLPKPPESETPSVFGAMMGRGGQMGINVPLKYPAKNPGAKITLLRGENHFEIATQTQSVEFTDFKNDKEQTLKASNGASMTIVSFKPDPNVPNQPNIPGGPQQFQLKFKVSRGSMSQEAFNQLQQSIEIRVLDAAGHELMFQGQRENNSSDKEIRQTVLFYRPGQGDMRGEAGAPVKVVWVMMVQSKELTVPFEFKDVPIP